MARKKLDSADRLLTRGNKFVTVPVSPNSTESYGEWSQHGLRHFSSCRKRRQQASEQGINDNKCPKDLIGHLWERFLPYFAPTTAVIDLCGNMKSQRISLISKQLGKGSIEVELSGKANLEVHPIYFKRRKAA